MKDQERRQEPDYSQKIRPEEYYAMRTPDNPYLVVPAIHIIDFIDAEIKVSGAQEIVEAGCGPFLINDLLRETSGINLTSVDHDPNFLKYARSNSKVTNINYQLDYMDAYQHRKPVDVFYSHGVHHRIAETNHTESYFNNIYDQLKPGGAYVFADEFLPEYQDEDDRQRKSVIWYSHTIANARQSGFNPLARENTNNLLNDLNSDRGYKATNSPKQIAMTLNYATWINNAVSSGNFDIVHFMVEEFLTEMNGSGTTQKKNSPIERKNCKISGSVFRSEVESIGFSVEKQKTIGSHSEIGTTEIYKLRKPVSK